MRIVSGTLKGRRLKAPTGQATRPTADRVREAVFNILGGRIHARLVLDLYAGTGALGIEALSRGAAQAIFVDGGRAALAALHHNLSVLGISDRARVYGRDIRRNDLAFLSHHEKGIDLVFMDPPYNQDMVLKTLSDLVESATLAPQARIVIEHSPAENVSPPPSPLHLADQRRYGKTLVSFLDCVL